MNEASRTIWCGNLPRDLKDEVLFELFLQAGPLERVHRPKDQKTGEPRQFAFVVFEDEESVPYALELFRDTRLYGRLIRMQAQQRGGGPGESRPVELSRSVSAPSHLPPPPPREPASWRPAPSARNAALLQQMAAQQMLLLAQQAALVQPFGWPPPGPGVFRPALGYGAAPAGWRQRRDSSYRR